MRAAVPIGAWQGAGRFPLPENRRSRPRKTGLDAGSLSLGSKDPEDFGVALPYPMRVVFLLGYHAILG